MLVERVSLLWQKFLQLLQLELSLTLGKFLSVQDIIDAVRYPFRLEDTSFTQSRIVAIVERDPETMQHKPERVAGR